MAAPIKLADIAPIYERCMAEGITDRETIILRILEEVEIDPDTLRRMAADKALSLFLCTQRDEDNVALAVPSRNEDGERIIVDRRYSHDAAVLRKTGMRMETRALGMLKASKILLRAADEIDHLWSDLPESEWPQGFAPPPAQPPLLAA